MVTLGLIGCGVISDSYLTGAARSALVKMKSVADLRPEAAQAQAEKYGVQPKAAACAGHGVACCHH